MAARRRQRRRGRRGSEPERTFASRFGRAISKTLDEAVYSIAPSWGIKRIATRRRRDLAELLYASTAEKLSSSDGSSGGGGYGSARHTRDSHDWLISRLSPNSDLEYDRPTMVERADSTYKNHELGRGFVEGKVRRVVGTGMTIVPSLTPREGLMTEKEAARLESAFRWHLDLWLPRAGKKGESMWLVQRLVERHFHRHGEAFLLLGDEFDPLSPVTLKIEVIHPRRVSTPPGQEGNPRIRMGIEYDERDRPIAYHIRERHPGDTKDYSYKWQRKEVNFGNGLRQVLHVFDPTQADEGRGYPAMQIGLPRLKNADDFDEASLERAWVENCHAAFVRSELPPEDIDSTMDVVNADGKKLYDIEPGTINYMGVSDEIDFSSPSSSDGNFTGYMEHQGRMFAAGVDSPYEAVANNWKGLSYSGGKIITNSEEGSVSCEQKMHAIWLWDVHRNMISRIVTGGTGLLPDVNIDQLLYRTMPFLFDGCRVIPPRRMSIDPAKEHRVELMDAEAGLYPVSDLVEQRTGRPAEEVYRAIQRDRKSRQKCDLEIHMPQTGRDAYEPAFAAMKPDAAGEGRPPTQAGDKEPGNQAPNDQRSSKSAAKPTA